MLISLIVLEFCPGQDFSIRGIIKKPGKIELWFFDTALPLNALFYCIKFQQLISKGFLSYAPDKTTDGRTDEQTDKRTRRRLYGPSKFFGEHKKTDKYRFYFNFNMMSENF
jgi:hypothetical protein